MHDMNGGGLEKVAVVVPAFNEEGKIGEVVRKVRAENVGLVVVTDDCSTDRTAEEAAGAGAVVLRHAANRGVGAGIRTGLLEARRRGFEVAAVLSGDDQHNPDELGRVAAAVLDGSADMVQGSRRLPGGRAENIGAFRDVTTRLYAVLFRLVTGFPSTDATNGFRVFRLSLLDEADIRLEQDWLDRYELEPYLLYKVVRSGRRVVEAPVTIRYHAMGTTKMRPLRDWWLIFRPLVLLALGMRR